VGTNTSPFRLSLAEIGQLTPYQVRHVYLVAKDPKTGLPVRKTDAPQTYRQVFYSTWKRRGLKKDEIDLIWGKHLEKEKAKLEARKAARKNPQPRTPRTPRQPRQPRTKR